MLCLWLVTCSGTPVFPGSQCSWGMAGVWGWVTLWHHSCLCSGWEERGPSEICQPTAQMLLCCLAPDPPSRDNGVFLEDTSTVREPTSPRQNLPAPTSGGTGTCLPSEDSPQETGRSLAELLQALVHQVFLQESFPGCTPPALVQILPRGHLKQHPIASAHPGWD